MARADVTDRMKKTDKAQKRDGRPLFWARRPFGYCGKDLDRGEVLQMGDGPNDQKLQRLEYVFPVLATDAPMPCRLCGREFIDLNHLNTHGHKRHEEKRTPPPPVREPRESLEDYQDRLATYGAQLGAAEDQALMSEMKQLEQLAPLRLDQTEASRR